MCMNVCSCQLKTSQNLIDMEFQFSNNIGPVQLVLQPQQQWLTSFLNSWTAESSFLASSTKMIRSASTSSWRYSTGRLVAVPQASLDVVGQQSSWPSLALLGTFKSWAQYYKKFVAQTDGCKKCSSLCSIGECVPWNLQITWKKLGATILVQ